MKRKIVLFCLLGFVFASGCGDGTVPGTNVSNVGYRTPDVSEIGDGFGSGYSYLIDNSTGVVYLKYVSGHGKAITVLLKPDGTPVMKEDIMKEKGE